MNYKSVDVKSNSSCLQSILTSNEKEIDSKCDTFSILCEFCGSSIKYTNYNEHICFVLRYMTVEKSNLLIKRDSINDNSNSDQATILDTPDSINAASDKLLNCQDSIQQHFNINQDTCLIKPFTHMSPQRENVTDKEYDISILSYDSDVDSEIDPNSSDNSENDLERSENGSDDYSECSENFSINTLEVLEPRCCLICNQKRNGKSFLFEHVESHFGVMPYFCVKCNFSSFSLHTFYLHSMSHIVFAKKDVNMKRRLKHFLNSRKIVHSCLQCGLSLKNNSLLAQHYITHLQDSFYKCKICNLIFLNKNECVIHSHLHEAKPECKICELVFSPQNYDEFLEHVANHESYRYYRGFPRVRTSFEKLPFYKSFFEYCYKVYYKSQSKNTDFVLQVPPTLESSHILGSCYYDLDSSMGIWGKNSTNIKENNFYNSMSNLQEKAFQENFTDYVKLKRDNLYEKFVRIGGNVTENNLSDEDSSSAEVILPDDGLICNANESYPDPNKNQRYDVQNRYRKNSACNNFNDLGEKEKYLQEILAAFEKQKTVIKQEYKKNFTKQRQNLFKNAFQRIIAEFPSQSEEGEMSETIVPHSSNSSAAEHTLVSQNLTALFPNECFTNNTMSNQRYIFNFSNDEPCASQNLNQMLFNSSSPCYFSATPKSIFETHCEQQLEGPSNSRECCFNAEKEHIHGSVVNSNYVPDTVMTMGNVETYYGEAGDSSEIGLRNISVCANDYESHSTVCQRNSEDLSVTLNGYESQNTEAHTNLENLLLSINGFKSLKQHQQDFVGHISSKCSNETVYADLNMFPAVETSQFVCHSDNATSNSPGLKIEHVTSVQQNIYIKQESVGTEQSMSDDNNLTCNPFHFHTQLEAKILNQRVAQLKSAIKVMNKNYNFKKTKVRLHRLPYSIYHKHIKGKPIMLSSVLPTIHDY